jgi:predicted RNase H-related nuclease YkuK (DUF458 family)
MTSAKIDREELVEFLAGLDTSTKIYVGCDSEVLKVDNRWMVDYILVVVIHINGNNGCRIFHEVIREEFFDKRKDKPTFRLMNEAYKLSSFYLDLADFFRGFDTQVHLDLNPDEAYVSSLVVNQAIGYIKGTCGVDPMVKPDAWAASYAADRAKDLATARRKSLAVAA